ncbi:MAG: hypothetical protein JWM21_439 [Acidobacteria bacterium]|nr:hypothetical protein [Acidobacteriota bacterium]
MGEQSSLKSISEGLSQLYQAVRQIHSFLNRPEVKEKVRLFFERLRDLPEDTKRFLRDLAYRGWFFTDEMTLNEISVFYNLTTAQNSVDEAQIDIYMEALVEKYKERIKKSLYTRYPARKNVLESAFNAHDRGEYNLSIPVFLAQADGIGTELLRGISPFSRKTSSPGTLATAAEINNLSALVDTTLIEPLGLPMAMTAKSTSSERLGHPHLYNRHEVLHGISLDYGNNRNSLKAISLLGHLATVVHDVVEEYSSTSSPSISNP